VLDDDEVVSFAAESHLTELLICVAEQDETSSRWLGAAGLDAKLDIFRFRHHFGL
jgi:hypothetical protein